MKIRESNLGKDHPETAVTYNNIAGVYKAKGEYDRALVYYLKALEVKETKLGKDHPDTATTYNNIAGVHYAKCEYDKALDYHKKALEIREVKLGKDHPDTATTYNNIAGVHYAKGEYDNALDFFVKAIKIWLNRDCRHPDAKLYFDNVKLCYNESKKKQPFEDWMKGQLDDNEWVAFLKLMKGE